MTLSCGLTTRVLALLNPPLSFFVNNNMFPGTNHFETGFGHYHAQKNSNLLLESYAQLVTHQAIPNFWV